MDNWILNKYHFAARMATEYIERYLAAPRADNFIQEQYKSC